MVLSIVHFKDSSWRIENDAMRPVVSTGKAWFCTILSAFGVIILTPIAHLFNTNHESFVGSINDPEDGPAVAHTVYIAALVYLVFFVFCGSQVYFASRKRSIALR